ncbi:MAG TPA: AIR synthase related protein [Actinomycetota bacterium]|nr:AIR synthase related protein [Actinomycetota bacterium]
MTTLDSIAARFASHPGLRAKAALRMIPGILGPTDWVGGPGDDTAAMAADGGFLLAAGEAMFPPFVAADPYGAGVASVVANVNDVAAMGGRTVALTNTLIGPEAVLGDVMRGMRFACDLYGVPMVGGHLSVWDGPPSVSAFIVGRASALLSSSHAAPGQSLLAAFCVEGRMRDDFPYFSSVRARGADLGHDVTVLPAVAEAGCCLAAKDVSMAGLLGSLAMLLEATGSGAVVDLTRVPRPEAIDLEPWLFTFPTFGFLLCAPPSRADECRQAFQARGLACAEIGAIEPGGCLRVCLGAEEAILLDVATAGVTGLGGLPAVGLA